VGGSFLVRQALLRHRVRAVQVGDLCCVALEAAEKGVPLSVVEKQEKKPGVLGQAGEALGEGLDKVGKKLKELFGK
jgi:hypothetical protein